MSRFIVTLVVLLALLSSRAFAAGFHLSTIGTLTVDSKNTYYDNSNGLLFSKVPLPAGATAMEFAITGSSSPFANGFFASADGLDSNGNVTFQHVNTFYGAAPTYQNTPIGKTTGDDPGLFGVFFSANGTEIDSADYRTGGPTPGLKLAPSYSPAVNQPFWIGDGLDQNNKLGATALGNLQVFNIPAGASYLLLGNGSDNNMGDNNNPAGFSYAYSVQVSDNSVPEPGSLALLGLGAAALLRRRSRA